MTRFPFSFCKRIQNYLTAYVHMERTCNIYKLLFSDLFHMNLIKANKLSSSTGLGDSSVPINFTI